MDDVARAVHAGVAALGGLDTLVLNHITPYYASWTGTQRPDIQVWQRICSPLSFADGSGTGGAATAGRQHAELHSRGHRGHGAAAGQPRIDRRRLQRRRQDGHAERRAIRCLQARPPFALLLRPPS